MLRVSSYLSLKPRHWYFYLGKLHVLTHVTQEDIIRVYFLHPSFAQSSHSILEKACSNFCSLANIFQSPMWSNSVFVFSTMPSSHHDITSTCPTLGFCNNGVIILNILWNGVISPLHNLQPGGPVATFSLSFCKLGFHQTTFTSRICQSSLATGMSLVCLVMRGYFRHKQLVRAFLRVTCRILS